TAHPPCVRLYPVTRATLVHHIEGGSPHARKGTYSLGRAAAKTLSRGMLYAGHPGCRHLSARARQPWSFMLTYSRNQGDAEAGDAPRRFTCWSKNKTWLTIARTASSRNGLRMRNVGSGPRPVARRSGKAVTNTTGTVKLRSRSLTASRPELPS